MNPRLFYISIKNLRIEVAIKVAHNKDAKDNMLEEAKTMIRVSKHDHIVNFQGLSVQDDAVYLLLEFCALGRIDDYLRKHAKELNSKLNNDDCEDLVEWCAQIADGMAFLVQKNIIHVSMNEISGICYSKHFYIRYPNLSIL